jgi:hypothetical protein
MDYRPHCSGFPVQYGDYHPGPKLQLPLGLTTSAFLVLGPWPSHHRPLSHPLFTIVFGFSHTALWTAVQHGVYYIVPTLGLLPWTDSSRYTRLVYPAVTTLTRDPYS